STTGSRSSCRPTTRAASASATCNWRRRSTSSRPNATSARRRLNHGNPSCRSGALRSGEPGFHFPAARIHEFRASPSGRSGMTYGRAAAALARGAPIRPHSHPINWSIGTSEGKMRVGFIGLGMMGKAMAANLQKAGHQLTVHDLNRAAAEPFLAKGAEWANSPRAVAEASEVIFTSLPVPADVEAVALGPNGLIEGMRPDTAFFDMSTNSVAMVRKINAAFAEKNLYMLDSPVSGGPGGAASGKMAIWVGGDEQQFGRHKAVLEAMGDQARYIGPIGAGTIAKLVHNCTSAVVGVAL